MTPADYAKFKRAYRVTTAKRARIADQTDAFSQWTELAGKGYVRSMFYLEAIREVLLV